MSKQKMSRWGVGPLFLLISAAYVLITLLISNSTDPFFRLDFISRDIRNIVALTLLASGVISIVISGRAISKAFNCDELVTNGVFSYCRHPIYATWIILLGPGIFLFLNNWLSLTSPVFMYILFRVLIVKEEVYLEKKFGKEYSNYKKRVPCIIPYGFLTKK